VLVALALAFEEDEELLEELPHAASSRPASRRISTAVAGLRLLMSMWGMDFLCRGVKSDSLRPAALADGARCY
jgi:hypothetical protein